MSTKFKFKKGLGRTLLVACGALAKEVIQIIESNKLNHLDVQCLPAGLHHRPALIPTALDKLLEQQYKNYDEIYVVYGDCGTAGGIDKVIEKYNAQRISGPHCFSFYEGNDNFTKNEDDITSFFLTDFFCHNFEKFMWQQYGLDRDEGMVDLVFGNYKKLVYVAQTKNLALKDKALKISKSLNLSFEYRYRGYSDLGIFIKNI